LYVKNYFTLYIDIFKQIGRHKKDDLLHKYLKPFKDTFQEEMNKKTK